MNTDKNRLENIFPEIRKSINSSFRARKPTSRKINFRLRDAIFSRQRYWGEPFPIYYKDEMPYPLDESELPLVLPEVGTSQKLDK